ncbi:MAG: ABC transporter ATP-binding protein/permease, partial [Oscillospiraceae bacterium]|nr:ABC transporter ATP-binding protein/permease [Oscillospiraceae bacterium]
MNKGKKKTSFMETARFFISLQWGLKKSVVLLHGINFALEQVKQYLGIYLAAQIVRVVTERDENGVRLLALYVLMLAVVEIGGIIASNFQTYIRISNDHEINAKLLRRKLEKLSRIKLEYFESSELYRTGASIDRLDASQINSGALLAISAVSLVMTIAVTGAALLGVSPALCAVFVAAYIPAAVYNYKKGGSSMSFVMSQHSLSQKLNSTFNFVSDRGAVQEVKIFGATPYLIEKRTRLFARLRRNAKKHDLGLLAKGVITSAVPLALYYAAYYFLGARVLSGPLEIEDFIFATGCIAAFSGAVENLAAYLSSASYLRANFENFREFFDYEEEAQYGGLPPASFDVDVRSLRFRYPGAEIPALDGLNLNIEKHKKTAIVGLNGSGKTTLSKILLGLYTSYEGE